MYAFGWSLFNISFQFPTFWKEKENKFFETHNIYLPTYNRWNVKYYLWIISREEKKSESKSLLIDHAMSQVTEKLLLPEGVGKQNC